MSNVIPFPSKNKVQPEQRHLNAFPKGEEILRQQRVNK